MRLFRWIFQRLWRGPEAGYYETYAECAGIT